MNQQDPTPEGDGVDQRLREALDDLVTAGHAEEAVPLLRTYLNAEASAGQARALVLERYFADGDGDWPKLHRRFCVGGRPLADLVTALSDAVTDRLLRDLAAAPASLPGEVRRTQAMALDAAHAEVLAACRAAAERTLRGPREAGNARLFQHSTCTRAWRRVLRVYVQAFPPSVIQAVVGGRRSAAVTDALRTNVAILAPAIRLGDLDHLRVVARATPVEKVITPSQRTALREDLGTGGSAGTRRSSTGRRVPIVDREGAQDQVLDDVEGLSGAALPNKIGDRYLLDGLPGDHVGPKHPEQSQLAYLEVVAEFLRSRVRDAMIELRHVPERPDLVLDHIRPDGKPDKAAIAKLVKELALSGGGNVDPRVRRAWVRLQRILSQHGFVQGDIIQLKGRENFPEVPIVLPPGAPDPLGALTDSQLFLLSLELDHCTLPAVMTALGRAWPPVDGWTHTRSLLADLKQARAVVRERLDAEEAPSLFEKGLVSPPPELPPELRLLSGPGRKGASSHVPRDPIAAIGAGREIVKSATAVLLEEKRSWPARFKTGTTLPLPEPLHKTHGGAWWYFPEGGVTAPEGTVSEGDDA